MSEKFAEYADRANTLLKNHYKENPLLEPLRDALFASRKRIRANMGYLGCGVVGGNVFDADAIGTAYEMITSAYILIDDSKIFDSGNIRAGKPTIRMKYGEPVAVLTSLLLQAEPMRLLPKTETMTDIFYKSVSDTILGELYDQKLSQKPKESVEDVRHLIEIAKLKTGALLAGAAVSGAVIGGGSEKEQLSLSKFAYDLGTAYQLSDHVIDIIGDEKETGKDTFSDVKSNKKSTVINYALSVLDSGSNDRKLVVDSLGREEISESDRKRLKEIFIDSGSIDYAYDLVLDFNKKAAAHLDGLQSNDYRDLLSKIHRMYTAPLEVAVTLNAKR